MHFHIGISKELYYGIYTAHNILKNMNMIDDIKQLRNNYYIQEGKLKINDNLVLIYEDPCHV